MHKKKEMHSIAQKDVKSGEALLVVPGRGLKSVVVQFAREERGYTSYNVVFFIEANRPNFGSSHDCMQWWLLYNNI